MYDGEFVTHVDLTRATPFKMNRPGRDWLDGFLGRHPDIGELNRFLQHSSQDTNAMTQWLRSASVTMAKYGDIKKCVFDDLEETQSAPPGHPRAGADPEREV